MEKPVLTQEIQQEAKRLIDIFNEKTFKGSSEIMYVPRFKSNCLYLDRKEYDKVSPVARLTYTGNFNKWKFAIFKWTRDAYDPDEWMFPGSNLVNGTIEGAMNAGLAAYPI